MMGSEERRTAEPGTPHGRLDSDGLGNPVGDQEKLQVGLAGVFGSSGTVYTKFRYLLVSVGDRNC